MMRPRRIRPGHQRPLRHPHCRPALRN